MLIRRPSGRRNGSAPGAGSSSSFSAADSRATDLSVDAPDFCAIIVKLPWLSPEETTAVPRKSTDKFNSVPGWHRADIIAAVRKRGFTLEALARANGKGRSSMSAALLKPSRGCNLIIAEAIGVPLHELWPSWFDHSGRRIRKIPSASASQKRRAA
ncbi:helix-turn-helix domain-containing protein [Bradyrhizobium sp. BR 10289]|nr:helix-turn-helix domain-containing protein [Bradyrhizobium sp. BR 10289]